MVDFVLLDTQSLKNDYLHHSVGNMQFLNHRIKIRFFP